MRAILGQQISVAAARTHAARIVERHGEPLPAPDGALTHVFPTAAALAEADDDVLAMPVRRRETLRGVCAAIRDGLLDLDPGADRERTRRDLLALPGIGPWTVEYVAMRALGDPDAFPASDLGVLHGLRALGVEADAREAERRSQAWRPFRAYTVLHLWKALESGARDVSETYTTMPSPVGELLLTAEDGRLTGLYLPSDRYARHAAAHPGARRARRRRLRTRAAAARGVLRGRAQRVRPAGRAGRARRSSRACGPSSSASATATTITYAELAARIGRPTAIRAAGAANGANPVSIVIPCHRVIGSNGTLTGYGGGLDAKRFLLELERAGA